MRIAFQGELGSNGHELCTEAFADHEPVPCATFADAFSAVRSGECDLGLMAMENSAAGRVADVHALLPDSGLEIVGERFKRVRLYLMAPAGTRLEDLRVVRSHQMALAQCRQAIGALGLRGEVALDTAGAARALAQNPEPGVCAIAPRLAAELYGLEVLKEAEDDPRNTTRFIVVTAAAGPPPAQGVACVTSLFFKTRDVPAALYKAIGAFATNGVNLLKLESYLEGRGHFKAASFYAEVEGRPSDRPVALALEELAFFTNEYAIAGVYAADPAREMSPPRASARPVDAAAPLAAPAERPAPPTATLAQLRHTIDNIDAAVIHLLAERFKTTGQVGMLKAEHGLASTDPDRERQQLVRLRRLAEAADLEPAFAEQFLTFVIKEVVQSHNRLKEAQSR